MSKYKVLKRNEFKQKNYKLVPIRPEDRYSIMQWRNEQMYHLRQAKPLTIEAQEDYFLNIVANLLDQEMPSQILFSFLKDNICIGYGGLVHINWVDKNAEVSFIMDTHLEADFFAKNWRTYLGLIEQVAFTELDLHKIFTYAFDLRPHLYPVLEQCGFYREAELADHCLFNGSYKKVVIHAKINQV